MSQYADQVMFATGRLVGTRVDAAGTGAQDFGILQDVSLDFTADVKMLYGQSRYPVMQAPAKSKIELKAKTATVRGDLYNDLFFAAAKTAAQARLADNESGAISAVTTGTTSASTASGSTLHFSATPAGVVVGASVTDTTAPSALTSGTYVTAHDGTTVTLNQAVASTVGSGDTIVFGPSFTATHAADFLADQGVYLAANGQRMTPASTHPLVAGTYAVAAGIYVFAVADAGKAIYASYTYSTTAGVKLAISNLAMGIGPAFSVVLSNSYDGRQGVYTFPNCMAGKLSLPLKQDDYLIAELDFTAAADIAGNIATINLDL